MQVIVVLIIVSMLVALGFLGAFVFAVKDGQFDDTVGPSVRILDPESFREVKRS